MEMKKEMSMRSNFRMSDRAVVVGSAVMAMVVVASLVGYAQRNGVTANRLIDNERVSVQRLTAKAGLTEQMHKSPMDIVAIQATPGEIEMQIGGETTKGVQGKVWYLPKTVDHALFNRGAQPVDMIVVNVK
jgi:quercetin dioxygenase-like cupin family protein